MLWLTPVTRSQASGLIMSNFLNFQLLKFPNTDVPIFPGEDGVPGKISIEIHVLLLAKM